MSSSTPGSRRAIVERIRSRPWTAGLVALGLVAVAAVGFVWFQPQALFLDRVVDEEFPVAAGGEPESMDDDTTDGVMADDDMGDDMVEDDLDEPMGLVALSSGKFESRSRYTVEGVVTVFRLEDGSRVLRLEDFSSTNGPDLYVYLTSADASESDQALDADFVDLGLLSGNIGNQNYAIGDHVDLDRYDTVVIWCRRFTVGFGAADLTPTG